MYPGSRWGIGTGRRSAGWDTCRYSSRGYRRTRRYRNRNDDPSSRVRKRTGNHRRGRCTLTNGFRTGSKLIGIRRRPSRNRVLRTQPDRGRSSCRRHRRTWRRWDTATVGIRPLLRSNRFRRSPCPYRCIQSRWPGPCRCRYSGTDWVRIRRCWCIQWLLFRRIQWGRRTDANPPPCRDNVNWPDTWRSGNRPLPFGNVRRWNRADTDIRFRSKRYWCRFRRSGRNPARNWP